MKVKMLCIAMLLLALLPAVNAQDGAGRLREIVRSRMTASANAGRSKNVSVPASVSVERDLAYGRNALQKLDVYHPKNSHSSSKLPVLIFVHGGGWSRGDKAPHAVKGIAYAQKDIVFANLNYRLAPQTVHPEQVTDIALAIKYVHENISKWGGDPERIYLMGHSAGAHLVDLVATNQKFLNELHVNPACLAGVISLDTASLDLLERMKDDSPELNMVGPMIDSAFGKDPKVLKDGSPTLNIQPGVKYPPFLMFCGSRRLNAVSQHNVYSKKLNSVGGQSLIKTLPLSHRDISLHAGDASAEIFHDVTKFIENTKP